MVKNRCPIIGYAASTSNDLTWLSEMVLSKAYLKVIFIDWRSGTGRN